MVALAVLYRVDVRRHFDGPEWARQAVAGGTK
jgi:hypothetical protein